MSDRDRDLDAAEYALGTLEGKERDRVERLLDADPALREKLAAWEGRLSALDDSSVTVAPSEGLWQKIAAGLEGPPKRQSGSVTIHAEEGEWLPLHQGVEKKTLLRDEARGEESYLLRLAPGARLPAHAHGKTEECLLLEGDFQIGELQLQPGDYHAAFADSRHLKLSSRNGALLFIRGELRAAG